MKLTHNARLVIRLLEELHLPIRPDVELISYRGRKHGDASVWSWFLFGTPYGSPLTVKALLSCPRLTVFDHENGHLSIMPDLTAWRNEQVEMAK